MTKDGAIQQQGMVERVLMRARAVLDKGSTSGLGHTEVASSGDLGEGQGDDQERGRGTGRGEGDYVAVRIGSDTAKEGE